MRDHAGRGAGADRLEVRRAPDVAEVASFVARCGLHRLVVRAEHVRAVADRRAIDHDVLDASALLGVDPDPSATSRALELDDGRMSGRGVWLAVGVDLQLRRLLAPLFQPLPSWLPPLLERLPFAAVVDLGDGFAFEVDVVRLAAQAGQAGNERHG